MKRFRRRIADRFLRTRRQRGAAVFVVVLIITMLTTIGVFAASATSGSVRVAGANRQATQNQAAGEYVALAAFGDLVKSQGVQLTLARANALRTDPDQCLGYANLTSLRECYKFGYDDLTRRIADPDGDGGINGESLFRNEDGGVVDSDGGTLYLAPIGEVDFQINARIEVADVTEAAPPVAGNLESARNTPRNMQADVNVIVEITPASAADSGAPPTTTTEIHGQIVVGPMPPN